MTEETKAQNRSIAQARITIEHVIGGVKISRIVKDIFRGLLKHRRDLVMRIACGLHNLRNQHRGYKNPLLNFS